ncbi:MAG: glycerophosphodiester phosphodiesterase family protein [Pseudomonadota bacterium]|nr:glycerophosphodiester phosphodiesterase family protein [Pseudomonadota bacterium]
MSLPDWLTGQPVAHRGYHVPGPDCPENSLAALAAAEQLGYAAEIDVQLSSDGVVMIFHDRTLDRLCGVPGRLSDRTAGALQRLRLADGPETIPNLWDALVLFPDLPLLIELKMGDMALAPAVADLLDDHGGPFAVQSFDPEIVGWFADHRPGWPRGLIAYRRRWFGHRVTEPRFRPEFLETARPHFVAWSVNDLPVHPSVPGELPVLTWTVRNARQRHRAGVHARNMIFEGFRA